jgi:ornithine cyclodeaminase
MELTIIGRAAVRELLPMAVCIELMEHAMGATARGETLQPPRWIVPLPGSEGNGLGLMPGWMADPEVFGAKVTAVFPGNSGSELQSHQGAIVLFEGRRGSPMAIVHGGEVTAIRTAAASALATRLLARDDACELAVLGYGEQAAQHIEAMACVRRIQRVRVWGRSPERAARFPATQSKQHGLAVEAVASVEAAVRGSDIICTTSAAAEPILQGDWVSSGTHLNVVGSSVAAAREIDDRTVERSRFYVDYKPSTVAQGGEYLAALSAGRISAAHILGEIGEVITGRVAGRTHRDEITLYKSLGIPVEDLVSAEYLWRQAQSTGLATRAPF